jgi:hypothetical protein
MSNMGRRAILTSFTLAAAASPLSAAPPRREGPVGPAQLPPPPPPKYGPIGPAQSEGPQGQDMTGIRNITLEGTMVWILFDNDLNVEDRFGGRGRVYFPLSGDIEGAFGITGTKTRDESDNETVTAVDLHAGAFLRNPLEWRGELWETVVGATGGLMRFNGADPDDSSPFLGLEGGLRWFPAPDFAFGAGYGMQFTGTDANQRDDHSSAVVNHVLSLSIQYRF